MVSIVYSFFCLCHFLHWVSLIKRYNGNCLLLTSVGFFFQAAVNYFHAAEKILSFFIKFHLYWSDFSVKVNIFFNLCRYSI